MKRTVVTALLPLLVTPLVIAGGATSANAADESGGCALPTAERSYTHDQLVYRLALDLTDCNWWDGSPVQLDAGLDRFDPTGGHGSGSFIMCSALGRVIGENGAGQAPSDTEGAAAPGPANGDPAPPSDQAPPAERSPAGRAVRSGACAIEISIDHPSVEAAQYKGEITFPWQGDRRTVSFNALCGPAAGCVDLPVDPTGPLGTAADLYDGIAGGDNGVG